MAWAAATTISGPEAEPVTLDQAKAFVSIDADEDAFDVQLASFVTAARQQAENVTGVRLGVQQVLLLADSFADLARLPIGPVTSVDEIEWQASDGTQSTIDPADYELAGAGLAQSIRPVMGASWPQGALRAGAVRVTATVGFDPVPGPLAAAVLLMTGDLFAHRETAVVGTAAAKVPTSMQVDALLANYRIWL